MRCFSLIFIMVLLSFNLAAKTLNKEDVPKPLKPWVDWVLFDEQKRDCPFIYNNYNNKKWAIGICNPFNKKENIKIVYLSNKGIATSGTYERGNHIYNPLTNNIATEIKSMTVIGPHIYEADCFATACFAMGVNGINFLEKLNGFEGYMIDHDGIATFTTNFEKYLK